MPRFRVAVSNGVDKVDKGLIKQAQEILGAFISDGRSVSEEELRWLLNHWDAKVGRALVGSLRDLVREAKEKGVFTLLK